jgi:hypothetical protein
MELSELTYDPNTKETYWYIDDHGMVVIRGKSKSWRDSIGETFDALVCYEDEELLRAIIDCLVFNEDGSVTAFRHPAHITDDMSRDHVIYILLALKLFGQDLLHQVTEGLGYQISDKHKFSIDMWYWMKSLTGSKKYRRLYYLVAIPWMIFTVVWNKILYIIGDFQPEADHATYEFTPNYLKPEIQIQLHDMIFPAYATYKLAWMLFVMPDTWAKKVMQWLTMRITGRYNHVIQYILNRKNVADDIDISNYESMSGGRWTAMLNGLDTRGCEKIDKSLLVANDIQHDLLLTLHLNSALHFLEKKLA